MEAPVSKSSLERLHDFKEQSALLLSSVLMQQEVIAIMTDYEWRIRSLQEDVSFLKDALQALQTENKALQTKYSELLYRFSEVLQASKR